MIPLCRYILKGGNQCQQAAINGEYYCRHHLVVRRTVAATSSVRPDPYRVEQPLALVFPEDRAAQQLNVFTVMQAFNTGQIGPRSAKIYAVLLRECGMNLKQGPLYETNHETAVRRVEVTPEGEEIAPAREVPEDCASSDTRFAQKDSEATGEEPVGEDFASSDRRIAQEDEVVVDEVDQNGPTSQNRAPSASSGQDVGHPAIDENAPSLPVPHTSKSGLCGPVAEGVETQNDFACQDPCYIANLTERREQYRAFALNDLAAGRDPRAWEDFIPGKSRMRKPKLMVDLSR